MINLFNTKKNTKSTKSTNSTNSTNNNNIKNNTKKNSYFLKNVNKKSFIKKMKHSAKLKAKLKKYKPRTVKNYCQKFYKVDILGKVNKNIYNSCKIHKYCRQNKCNNIDKKNITELTKLFGKNYNMYIQSILGTQCPLTVTNKNINLCEKKALKNIYEKYGISDIYNKLNECNTVTCAKEKKIFYTNLFRTKQIKLKKQQKILLEELKENEEPKPDMDLIENGDL
jgi:hypothetical protein